MVVSNSLTPVAFFASARGRAERITPRLRELTGVADRCYNGNAAWSKQTALPSSQKVLLGQATPEQAVNEMIEGLKKATA